MTFKFREQSGQTNSDNYNQCLKEIITDLHSVFSESDILDKTITNHHFLNLSVLSQIKKDIKRLEDRIETMNLLADNNEGYVAASHDSFIDGSKHESKTSKPALYDASMYETSRDTFDNALKLSTSSDYDRINSSTIIEVTDQVGQGFASNDGHTIDSAIDTDPDSFWGEVILADGPLKVPFGSIAEGAICRFKITFSSPCTVSHIGFNPYTQFPLDLISIGYTIDTSDNIADYINIPNEKKVLAGPTTIDFPMIMAKALFITTRQKHAVRNQYLVSEDRLHDKEMWSKIIKAEAEDALSNVEWKIDDNNEQLDRAIIVSSPTVAYKNKLIS